MRTSILCLGLAVLLGSCSALSGPDQTKGSAEVCSSACREARELVAEAKVDIAAKKYSAATLKCQDADALVESYAEAKYCVLASGIGSLAEKAAALIRLFVGQMGPPDYRPTIDAKKLFSSLIGEIEETLILIDGYAYEVAALDDPSFQIADFPIGIDVSDLIQLVGSEEIVALGEVEVNLRGTWGASEALLIGAAVNAVMAGLDYGLAHELLIDSTVIDMNSTEGLATFLVDNPRLFTEAKDEESQQRLRGGDSDKGLRYDILSVLSYLTGRDEALEQVAPANTGLPAAIAAAAAVPATDAVVRWHDKDGDGYPEKIELPFLRSASRKILGTDGEPLFGDGTFEFGLQADTWNAIFATLKMLAANIEKGEPAAVSLYAPLRLYVRDILEADSNIRMLRKLPPDAVALNPGAFLKEPRAIADLLPHVFKYTYYYYDGAPPQIMFDMAMEAEWFGYGEVRLEKAGMTYKRNAADYAHFSYATPDMFWGGGYADSYGFDGYATQPETIAADGVVPSRKTPKLWYVSWQDPTFGGLLQGDPNFQGTGLGGKYVPMNSLSINRWMNKLFRYYCLDFEYGTLNGLFETGQAYVWEDNPIEECTQPVE